MDRWTDGQTKIATEAIAVLDHSLYSPAHQTKPYNIIITM